MKRRVIIVDTSILVVWLQVPGFDDAGEKHLTYKDIESKFKKEKESGATLLLTIACIIETGNHIAQIADGNLRYTSVNEFAAFIERAIDGRDGWKLYISERDLWSSEELRNLVSQWRATGIYKLSMGDASIIKVADKLKTAFDVEVFTGDGQLEALSKVPPRNVYSPVSKRN